ncbi:hypothetical protein F66182_3562 [Fusarium sp. NRRL 66182]|nr:hypothetical protein F66182_3562 [Fusarium sp. NRRL 66182]
MASQSNAVVIETPRRITRSMSQKDADNDAQVCSGTVPEAPRHVQSSQSLSHDIQHPTTWPRHPFSDLAALIRPIGLYNSRAARFLAFAKTWVEHPPAKTRRYRKLHYPLQGDGVDIGKDEVLDQDDERQGWEVAHLPSLGPYAIDSFRIFYRDVLRGLATDWNGSQTPAGFEPEWKRVVPRDKELRAYLGWMWLKEGWVWDPETGSKVKASAERIRTERARSRSLSPEGFRASRR